jgi:alpha-L-fucosidase 2
MKRREFIKTGTAVTGLMASMEISSLLAEGEKQSTQTGISEADNRSTEYLSRVKKGRFLPNLPVPGKSYTVSPMPLKERIKRKVVPQKGFCSISPGSSVRDALTSGNGKMNIELMGEPYSEQILFHHEELLMPWKKPIEAPNVASIFPQIRKLILDGKTNEAVALAVKQMNESPLKQDTEPHLTVPAFLMKLNISETSSVRNYLRTLNFESNEIKVIWSDKQGDWLRQTFASRPDNVVVQKIIAPLGKTCTLRISLEKSAQWSLVSGMDWGATRSIGSTNPDMAAFSDLIQEQKRLAPKGVEAN